MGSPSFELVSVKRTFSYVQFTSHGFFFFTMRGECGSSNELFFLYNCFGLHVM